MADLDKKISVFSAGTVDQSSYFLQANNGASSKVSAENIGDFTNTSQTYSGLNTTAKSVVGAINEVAGKKLSATLTAGSTSLTFTDASITTSSWVKPYASVWGVMCTNMVVSAGSVVLTFEAQDSDITVGVEVR